MKRNKFASDELVKIGFGIHQKLKKLSETRKAKSRREISDRENKIYHKFLGCKI